MTEGRGLDVDIDFDRVCTGDALTVLHDVISHHQELSADPNVKALFKLISMRFSTMNEIIRKQSIEIAQLQGNNQQKDGGRDAEPEEQRNEGD